MTWRPCVAALIVGVFGCATLGGSGTASTPAGFNMTLTAVRADMPLEISVVLGGVLLLVAAALGIACSLQRPTNRKRGGSRV